MSYIDYDELGMKTIRCMECGTPVAERVIKSVKIKSIPPRTENVLAMKQLSSWRRKRMNVEGGAYVDLILCAECIEKKIDNIKMTKVISDASEDLWKHEGRPEKDKSSLRKSLPKISDEPIKDELLRGKHGILKN